ncbi:hypothetical protein KIPB_006886 [Kipferlia bialata]|uniref:DUF998 domain-containing protein n=1 Tax=Kipferlia bialata TaxID=797122 RepID=A0A9K3CXP5_9EUKA|nr:hypothetical protein KIPB_006886 [Kipferlia bialata]|eukprot:g6886.t1
MDPTVVSEQTRTSPQGVWETDLQSHEPGQSNTKPHRLLRFVLLVVVPLNVAFVGWYYLSNSTYDPIMGLARLSVNISDAGSCDINPLGCRHFQAAFVVGGIAAALAVWAMSHVLGRNRPGLRRATLVCGIVLGLGILGVGVFHPDRGVPMLWGRVTSFGLHTASAIVTFTALLVTNLAKLYGHLRHGLSGPLGLVAMGALVLLVPRALYLSHRIEWAFVVAAYAWLFSQVMVGAFWAR